MKRALPLLLVLTAVLLCAQPARAQLLQGGYDEATRSLEEGFKIVASERIGSDDECYPAPEEIAAVLRREMGVEVVVAPSLESVQGFGLVNVVSEENECNRLVLAVRAGAKGRVFVLDSDYGPVYVLGDQGLSEESLAAGAGALRDLTAATDAFRMTKLDEIRRLEVLCPSGTSPLGGGWFNATPLGSDGEGLYPHSYERLGVQGGFHVTPVYVDPSTNRSPTRRGVIQAICGRGLVPTTSPHETTFVRRLGTGTVTARCPEDTQLFSGGFQRTNFTTPGVVGFGGIKYGGNYITESRAVGNGWRVSAGAVDQDGGELTAIAYCADQDRSLPLKVVSASAAVEEGESASATTPRCPRGRALIAGGFDFGGSYDALFADGYFTRAGTWSATGYGWFGSAELTAYGYCLKARDTVDRSDFPKEPLPGEEPAGDDGGESNAVIYIGLGLLGLALLAFLRRRQVVRRRANSRTRAG
jgi:MYXO-CTERM domain-containing protein